MIYKFNTKCKMFHKISNINRILNLSFINRVTGIHLDSIFFFSNLLHSINFECNTLTQSRVNNTSNYCKTVVPDPTFSREHRP